MNRNHVIILAIVVVLVVLVGIFAFMQPHTEQNGKINTEITFLSQDHLKNGEAVEFELKDNQGNPIATQNITIIFVEDGENQTYSIITDNDGKGSLVLNNEAPGSYEVIVSYNGTVRYNGCTATQSITIEEGAAEESSEPVADESDNTSEPVQSNSSAGTALYNGNSSSQGELYYDSQYNFYYDNNGIIRGGQNDGYSADYIRNIYESGDMVDEEGNLQ